MEIRRTSSRDLERILEIYAYAREQMKLNGNPTQWGDTRPTRQTVRDDIALGQSYVLCEGDHIFGVFAVTDGPEDYYAVIEDGRWLNDDPYKTVHRVASSGEVPGVLGHVLSFCETLSPVIRIDTHEDNRIMQHLLERYGYTRCGIVHMANGSPRIGYMKVRN